MIYSHHPVTVKLSLSLTKHHAMKGTEVQFLTLLVTALNGSVRLTSCPDYFTLGGKTTHDTNEQWLGVLQIECGCFYVRMTVHFFCK
jgi:hypothetical protein